MWVDLDRTFVNAPAEDADGDFEAMVDTELFFKSGRSWPSILKNRFVLILGTAGVGKTTEMIHQAEALVADGKQAFFVRLEDIAKQGLECALATPRVRELYDAWLNSAEPATFFLDSVDEAKIAAYHDFNRALKLFVSAVIPAAARVNVVLSCRPSDWMHITDLQYVKAAFAPLAQAARMARNEDDGKKLKVFRNDETAETLATETSVAIPEVIELAVLQLRPLDRKQVLILSSAFGLTDAEDFVSALEVKENLFMAATPRDLEWLTEYWRKHKRIGTKWEMMTSSIEAKLRERNLAHLYHDALSIDQSLTFTQRIAGANALCREPNIKLPDPGLLGSNVNGIEVEKLLDDIPAKLLSNLLRRPIYNEYLAGRVRIEPKGTRVFLAGLWLLRLIADGAPRANIRSLLIGSMYGKEKAISSLIEVAAWVSCKDSAIRAHLIRVAPEAVLFMGDAEMVPVEERVEAIRSFSRNHAATSKFDWIVNDADYARAAHPEMDTAVSDLLTDPSISFDTTKLLLRFASVGVLPKAASTAFVLSLNPGVSSSIRVWAIDAVARAGTEVERAGLRDALLAGTLKSDRLVERASRELFPRTLSLRDLEAVIDLFTTEGTTAIDGPSYTVAQYWTAKCPVDQLPAMLGMLLKKVLTKPLRAQRGFEPLLSEKYAWLIEAVGKCVCLVIENDAAKIAQDITTVNEALALVEKAKDQPELGVHASDAIEAVLRNNSDVRRAYIEYRFLTSTRHLHYLFGRSLSRPQAGDAEWMLGRACAAKDDAIGARLLMGTVEIWAMSGRLPDLKERIETAVMVGPLDEIQKGNCLAFLNPEAAMPDLEREDEQRKRLAAEGKAREEIKAEFEKNIAGLRDGSNYSAILYLLREMRQAPTASNSNWGQTNIEVVERLYSKDIADALRAGLSASWRRFTPALKSTIKTRNNVENGVLTGLTALALAFQDEFDFTTLTDDEARIATHYALRELNQFPRWFTVVANAKPDIVRPILIQEMKAQLSEMSSQPADILSLREIARSDVLAVIVGKELLEELPKLPRLSANALNEVLSVIDAAGIVDPNRSKNAAAMAAADWNDNQQTALVWLKEWLKSSPAEAINFLERKLSYRPDQAATIMKSFLLQLHDDIRSEKSGAYLRKVRTLKRLIPLAYKYVTIATDPNYVGVHSITPEDDAREARNQLAGLLETIEGMEAHTAIQELISNPDVAEIKHAFQRALERHAARAVEAKPWEIEQVREFATFYNREPQNAGELFRLVRERLEDIRDDIETGDTGDKGLVDVGSDETRLQRYFAGRVHRESRSRFCVVREPEVADHKKPDFRANHPKAGNVTIEVKPLDSTRYSFESLKATISTQLVNQYMMAARSNYGILLLCLLKAGRTWKISGTTVDFAGLLAALRVEAERAKVSNTNVSDLAIVGIDMSAWKAPKKGESKAQKKSKITTSKKGAKKAAKRKASAPKKSKRKKH